MTDRLAPRRAVAVVALLCVVLVVLLVLALAGGAAGLSPDRVVAALLGRGTDRETLVVLDWRLPRALGGVLVGAALGLSGAIFQILTRNPLGSPDVIGFGAGAETGAVVTVLVLGANAAAMGAGAVVGGLLTAAVVFALSGAHGTGGYRFVILGIAIGAALSAVNTWLVLTGGLEQALTAAQWGVGSLNELGWADLRTAGTGIGVCVLATALLARPLAVYELGEDTARALGVRVTALRAAAVAVGVALVAVCTATTGPISFVALAAPQIGRRLARTPGLSPLVSALTGAVLLCAADLVAQRAFGPTPVPVGMVTVIVGGAYLGWLLVRGARKEAL